VASYPNFSPPDHLAIERPRDWSRDRADEYRAWLLSVSNARVAGLLSYFDETRGDEPERVLERLGEKVAATLRRPEFSYRDGDRITLTNSGYALAADIGILVGQLLTERTRGVS
jgi:hypothetical protein